MPKVIFDMPNQPVKEVDLADLKTKDDVKKYLSTRIKFTPTEKPNVSGKK
jgi:hypothetical protein|tara:strand:- start:1012 stop:1161 length:150 start_codon:yes stop_codon:yes gene_type:complete